MDHKREDRIPPLARVMGVVDDNKEETHILPTLRVKMFELKGYLLNLVNGKVSEIT